MPPPPPQPIAATLINLSRHRPGSRIPSSFDWDDGAVISRQSKCDVMSCINKGIERHINWCKETKGVNLIHIKWILYFISFNNWFWHMLFQYLSLCRHRNAWMIPLIHQALDNCHGCVQMRCRGGRGHAGCDVRWGMPRPGWCIQINADGVATHHYTSLACCLSADSVRMGRIVKLM